jgi:hypothetical protein
MWTRDSPSKKLKKLSHMAGVETGQTSDGLEATCVPSVSSSSAQYSTKLGKSDQRRFLREAAQRSGLPAESVTGVEQLSSKQLVDLFRIFMLYSTTGCQDKYPAHKTHVRLEEVAWKAMWRDLQPPSWRAYLSLPSLHRLFDDWIAETSTNKMMPGLDFAEFVCLLARVASRYGTP